MARSSSRPGAPRFPYTTLFRSSDEGEDDDRDDRREPIDRLDPVELLARRLREPLEQDRDRRQRRGDDEPEDRKSTRLNSSHLVISYAVFCLKKKNNKAPASTNH